MSCDYGYASRPLNGESGDPGGSAETGMPSSRSVIDEGGLANPTFYRWGSSMQSILSVTAACAFALAACGSSLNGGSLGTGDAVANGGSTGTGGSPLDQCGSSSMDAGGSSAAGAAGGPWVDQTAGTNAADLAWMSVASDATGTHLVAVTTRSAFAPDGNIWTSADAGMTWTNRTAGTEASGQRWVSVASDSIGGHLVAVTGPADTSEGGDLWTSADAGMTWTKRVTVGAVEWPRGLASDATGTRLFVTAGGDVWASTDSGLTWTDQTAGTSVAGKIWGNLTSDATGDHLVVVNGDIWTSWDAGQTWINRTQGTPLSGLGWQEVASDSTGTRLVAVSQNSLPPDGVLCGSYGDIWVSEDSGATWINRTQGTAASGQYWQHVASDAGGANLVAASFGDLWRSADMGLTWTNETVGTPAEGWHWDALASDATGAHLVAVSDGFPVPADVNGAPAVGDIWTRQAP